MIVILKEFINDSNFRKSIALMLNSDEETGGANGVKYLVEEIGWRGKLVFAHDGGNNFDLDIKEKGVIWVKISASGKSAHGSRPWLGENAILKLINIYESLKKVFPPLGKRNCCTAKALP